MRIVIAPDSFKGSLSSLEAATSMGQGIRRVEPSVDCKLIPIADGGEGTVDAILASIGGKKVYFPATDPMGHQIEAGLGWIETNKTAVIEMAEASGLHHLLRESLAPEEASTFGTGQQIKAALDLGAEEIIIGLGGSATVDGGVGCLEALGVRFYDHSGNLISRVGGRLWSIYDIDASKLDPRVSSVRIRAASDVTNPLLGDKGAVYFFGPQKGVTSEEREKFERGMESYSAQVVRCTGKDFREFPGSGAAGGLGFGLLSFLGVQLVPGFRLVSEIARLEQEISRSDLVLTGEGSLDEQSLFGKVPVEIGKLARKHQVPAVAFAGKIDNSLTNWDEYGLSVILPIVDQPMSLEQAISHGSHLLTVATERFYRSYSLLKSK